jgi:phosphoglycolate phosphatase-like HAD superfamily hydrolase
MDKKTIVFDFDGVIHSYVSGWKGVNNCPDAPNDDVVETIRALREKNYEVIVVSTRCADPDGQNAVKQYLKRYRIEVDGVKAEKPPALVYVDDRAVCYKPGMDLLNDITSFKSWRG